MAYFFLPGMKSKLSIAMDEEHLNKITELIKTGRFRNKSHAIEYAVMHYLKEVKND